MFGLAASGDTFICTGVLMNSTNILAPADITAGGVAWAGSLSAMAAAVVASINSRANTNNNGVYVAMSSGATVYVSLVTTTNTDASINTTINVSSGGTISGIASGSLVLKINPSSVTLLVYYLYIGSANVPTWSPSGNVVAAASGGGPTYLYSWAFQSGNSLINISPQTGDGSVVVFSYSNLTFGLILQIRRFLSARLLTLPETRRRQPFRSISEHGPKYHHRRDGERA